ncbi:MAG: hypothetical protein LBV34_02910 [Nocardiopsaceae bacterium]|nr:hypothetical protein [Nocardiopsaceae bacterium]
MTGIAGLSLWIGPAPDVAPWDVFTLLNGAYRIYEGQAPGTDFANPIGPLVYGLGAIGMHLQHAASLHAITYGQVLFLVVASTLAWLVAWRRLPPLYAAAFTIFIAFLCISVRPLGYSPWTTTYAMLYNRDGWLLYAPLLLLALQKRKDTAGNRAATADGFMLGLLLGLLFYDKVTFFLAGMGAVVLGLILTTLPRNWRLPTSGLVGFCVVGAVMRLAFGVSALGYVSDFLAAARVQVAGQREGILADTILWVAPVVLVSALLVVVVLVSSRRRGSLMRPAMTLALAVAYVLGSSVLISDGDAAEKGDLPALVIAPLLIVVFLAPLIPSWAGGRASRGIGSRGTWLVRPGIVLVALAALLIGTTGPIVGKDALGLIKAIGYRNYDANPPRSQQFSAQRLSDFVIPSDAQWETAYREAHELPAMIDNGLRLLRGHMRPGDRVFTLAYTDPFALALGSPLSRCGLLWWDLGYDFDQAHHPDAACAIGTAKWVMIPRMVRGQGCCQETVAVMRHLFAGYLSRHYKVVTRTPDWILMRRVR